jgi:Uma2 family endonuclease
VDQFLDRFSDAKCELLGWETRPKPMPTMKHSKTAEQLQDRLRDTFGKQRVLRELSVRMINEIMVPDVAVLKSDNPRLYRDILDEPPLLCVEVVSSSHRPEEVLATCERHHEFGVPFCWVVDPATSRAWEYNLGEESREATDALSGPCRISLSDTFAEQQRTKP